MQYINILPVFLLLGLSIASPAAERRDINLVIQQPNSEKPNLAVETIQSYGRYLITGLGFDAGEYVGRDLREDFSLNPKRVSTVVQSSGDSTWEVQRLSNGKYTLSTRGAPTAVINDKLYALLIGQERAEEWVISSSDIENAYRIQTSDKSKEWYASSEPYTQVAIRASSPGAPPKESLFKISKVDDYYPVPEIKKGNIKIEISVEDL